MNELENPEFRDWLRSLREIAFLFEGSSHPDSEEVEELVGRARSLQLRVPGDWDADDLLFAEQVLRSDGYDVEARGVLYAAVWEARRIKNRLSALPIDHLLEVYAAVDRVAAVSVSRDSLPANPPQDFKIAATQLLDEVAKARYVADGHDKKNLAILGILDDEFTVNLADLDELSLHFAGQNDARRYSACRAVMDWARAGVT